MIIYITTAGYQLDGPLMDYYEKGADVLEGVIQDERAFYYMSELDQDDDIEDHSLWMKSNPNLGVTIKLEEMIEEWESRKHIPQNGTTLLLNALISLFNQTSKVL